MADLVVSGNTSGAVTLRAPDVSGTTLLTLPTTSGTLVVTGGAQTIEFADGTVSAPSITNSGDTNTGIYFPAADTIAFTEGGVESMRITSAGNVGIGLTSAGNRLVISQPVSTSFGTGGTYIGLGDTENAIGQTVLIGFGYRGSSTNEYPAVMGYLATNNGGNQAGALVFGTRDVTTNTAPTERMRIDSSGNVLIGTTSAATSSTLNVVGAGYQPIYVNSTATGGGGASFQKSGTLALYTGTAGSSWLTGSSTADGLIRSEANMLFAVGNTERMRITSAGELLVGTTSPNVYGVDFTQRIVGSGGYISQIQGAGAGADAVQWVHNINTSGTRGFIQFVVSGSTTVGKISSDGSTTTYGTSSDYRLKENIQPIIGALAKVANLKPVTYIWKNTGSTGEGFIAHELAEVCPYAVVGDKDDVDSNGNPVYQGVDTSFLVATLTAAIQELNAKVEAQAAEIQALKGAR